MEENKTNRENTLERLKALVQYCEESPENRFLIVGMKVKEGDELPSITILNDRGPMLDLVKMICYLAFKTTGSSLAGVKLLLDASRFLVSFEEEESSETKEKNDEK